ncbi:MAG: hypothetical protein LBI98_02840 [Endomicrobium sp.]|nr:hypothetical protein [Endomicrobium sp.]
MMLKRILSLLAVILTFSPLLFADKGYVINTPTVDMLDYDFCDGGLRFFSNGNLLCGANFGILKRLNIGASLELSRFVGKSNKGLKIAIPALQIKYKAYDGSMDYPGIAVGYDGQSCFFNRKYAGNYLQKKLGFYFVIGREFFVENLMINFGINFNNKVCWFINSVIPLYKEIVYLMAEAEYGNMSCFPNARFNLGLRFALNEYASIDCIVRDCCFLKKDCNKTRDRFFDERMLKMGYTIKF